MDVKRYPRFRRPGHAATGDRRASRMQRTNPLGHDYFHAIVDDHSRLAYGEYITRAGDIWSPRISNAEPLRLEIAHFVECVRENARPVSDGESGLRVVRVLERLQDELESSRRVRAAT
jgi:predicted dehydrogenase